MTPEQALAIAGWERPSETGHYRPPQGEEIHIAQLVLTAEILKELRRLCQKINEDMPIEPVTVRVENTVYTASAP